MSSACDIFNPLFSDSDSFVIPAVIGKKATANDELDNRDRLVDVPLVLVFAFLNYSHQAKACIYVRSNVSYVYGEKGFLCG